ncbi:MAG: HAD family phosphatase [Waddliaceae bacterium]
MIKGFLFDLDGTLVETEALKAESYAKAAVKLKPALSEEEVVEGFKDFVGLSREQVSTGLMKRFGLEEIARSKMEEFAVHQPWEAFAHVRLEIYHVLISDPEVINSHLCLHSLELLKWARENKYPTGLATQSHRPQTLRILEMLKITKDFDSIFTREDVDNPKPDPEIYLLLAGELNISPEESLVIEDSATGIQSALAAGMHCIAVTTDFTRKGVHQMNRFDKRWIVDSPSSLMGVVHSLLRETS